MNSKCSDGYIFPNRDGIRGFLVAEGRLEHRSLPISMGASGDYVCTYLGGLPKFTNNKQRENRSQIYGKPSAVWRQFLPNSLHDIRNIL